MVKLVEDEVGLGHTDRLVGASLLDYWSWRKIDQVQGEDKKYTKCEGMSNFLQEHERSMPSLVDFRCSLAYSCSDYSLSSPQPSLIREFEYLTMR